MNPIMVLPRHPHYEIAAWLNVLDLPQYNGNNESILTVYILTSISITMYIFLYPFFKTVSDTESFSKFYGVEDLMYFCEADIKQLGVRNSAHRARIVSSLVAFRDKYDNGKQTKAHRITVNIFAYAHTYTANGCSICSK